MRTRAGIDAGGTLIKIAYVDRQKLLYKLFPASQPAAAADWVQRHLPHAQVCVTGGKAALLRPYFADSLAMGEFAAAARGARYLAEQEGLPAGEAFILAQVGTGTSLHLAGKDGSRRLTGTGVGGGTILGLGSLLTGKTSFRDIVALAEQGRREAVDLRVCDIYEEAPPLAGDLTAANFSHPGLRQAEPEHLAAALIGMVGEVVTGMSLQAAEQYGVTHIVFAGSAFLRNRPLRETAERYVRLQGRVPLVLQNGSCCGAIGALFSLWEEHA
ncbi:type II pantothenate kinase [Ectobacillus ponti]|uniref:Type II pantothenate kinase n=1 Tax=Ectobacillus ponti TaxID=2961894 RepID=A0AA41X8P2_9BACI|nr:type II pantothenate kinase [Ectobacillus ponti]MCP8970832.1 type II pantothenate kinase [Ectobacillus ponti]